MEFDPAELDTLSRDELILRARARGVERPEQMTRVELRDEIVRLSEPDLERQRRTRGWLGVARDLLASVVESGLNLPDAAAAIRGEGQGLHAFQGPPPVATVTLAEIYATQGHYEQALRMLDEVIEREPEHGTARLLRDRIAEERDLGPGRRRKVVEAKGDPILTPQPPSVAPEPPGLVPEPEPVAATPEPVAATPEPEPVAPEPVAATPQSEPVLATPEPEPEPVAAMPEPEPMEPEPVATSPQAAPEREPEVNAGALHESAPDAASSREREAAPPVARPSEPSVLVLQTEGRAFLYWRLPSVSASVRLRCVTVRPSLRGPEVEEQDHVLTREVGGFWLSRQTSGTEVRAALGEVTNDSFSPFAVARVVGSAAPAFEPPGAAADDELEASARAAAGL